MERKIKQLRVVFFVAVMIGAGIIIAQTYKFPSSSYPALGLVTVLNQNQAPTDNLQGTKDSPLQYTTSTNSPKLIQTPVTKGSVQNQINTGFLAWMLKSPERVISSLFNADNETISSLFFQFMAENPQYQELFKQYDQLLSEEIEAQMMKFANETFQYVDLILSEGRVVGEWNTTSTVNNTTYTYVFKDYALEVNGTTQHLLKVSVYTSDGTSIIDPKIMITMAPLYYWVWFLWINYPVLYGYDFGIWIHYTPEETPTFLNNVFIELVVERLQCSYKKVATSCAAICTIVSFLATGCALSGNPAAIPLGIADAVIGATALILTGIGMALDHLAEIVWNDISLVAAFNAKEDSSFGFMLFQRFHYVASYVWWDPRSWTTFHIVYCNGVVLQTCPRTGVNYMDGANVDTYLNFLWWYSGNIGFNKWVWIGNG